MVMLNPRVSGAGATWFSCRKIMRWIADQPGPPYSFGQECVAQPFLFRMRCQRTVSSLRAEWPSRMRSRMSVGQVVADEGAHFVAEGGLFRREC